MADELLPYYNKELGYIRKLAAEFAEVHPKIAGRLRISADVVEDPHVSRLIEAFAYLNARIRHKLDDDFPELTDSLLGVLYPHYLAPIPSMAIVQMRCQPDMPGRYTVPAGAEIETEEVAGEPCRYRTGYPVTLWPITVEAASLTGRPLVAPANPRAPGAVASLRLTLRCLTKDMTFTGLKLDSARFFLRGLPNEVYRLYELIFNNAVSVALAESAADPNPVILDASCIRPVGFGLDEGLLPYSPRSFLGYRLLTEFFTFPEKFLFFDIADLPIGKTVEFGNKLEIFIYLNRTETDLERSISADSFALGCTPIINLFRQRTEPIQLSRNVYEYRVVPDARRQNAMEVYSVDKVIAIAPDDTEVEYLPFYSVKHAEAQRTQNTFWHASRQIAGAHDSATELYLSFVDLGFAPNIAADWVVSVWATCLNRDLPNKMPFGGGRPRLNLLEAASVVQSCVCLTAPTHTLRPALGQRARWRLISHLSLNHLSLSDAVEGADALREILKLYDYRDSAETRAVIDSILSVSSQRVAARVASRGVSSVCRGMEVVVEFDPKGFSGSGLYLLASVLERFFALYCTVNSFTRMVAKVKGRAETLRVWPPRAGDRALL